MAVRAPRIRNVSYVWSRVEEDVEVVLLLLGAPALLLQARVLLAVILRVPVLRSITLPFHA